MDNSGAVRDKDELIRFWGQNVRGQAHDKMVQLIFLLLIAHKINSL